MNSLVKYVAFFLICSFAEKVTAQTIFFGIGGALNQSKINFTSSDGNLRDYGSQLNFSQNLSAGFNIKGGFTSEINFRNTAYSGINLGLNHELSMNQTQASILFGYRSGGKLNWGVLAGVYLGRINNVRSTVDGKAIWQATEPAFDKYDFGSITKLFIDLGKDDSKFIFSPNLILLYGLKNIENQDQELKQSTKLNSVMCGLNVNYKITK